MLRKKSKGHLLFTFRSYAYLVFALLSVSFYPYKSKKDLTDIFKLKKVLVLGTGPSLELLDSKTITSFDVVVFLNSAIQLRKIHSFNDKLKIVFITDLHAFTAYHDEIIDLDDSWRFVVLPLAIREFPSLFRFLHARHALVLKPSFTIFAKKHNYGFERAKKSTASLVGFQYMSRLSLKSCCLDLPFCPLPRSVALNAFSLILRCTPTLVHYLGCDFSHGNASFIKQIPSSFPAHKMKVWLAQLRKLADKSKISFGDVRDSLDISTL